MATVLESFPREFLLQHLRITTDDHQQIIEVVSNAAGKLTHSFHLLCLAKFLFEYAPVALLIHELGNITHENDGAVTAVKDKRPCSDLAIKHATVNAQQSLVQERYRLAFLNNCAGPLR